MGKHYLLNLYDCPFDILNNELFLTQVITEAALSTRATLLKVISNQFHPQGVTVLALLSESHISIHTWPERNFASIDIFMCGNCDPQTAVDYLQKILEPSSVDQSLNRRGVISAVAQIYS